MSALRARISAVRASTFFSRPMTLSKKLRAMKHAANVSSTTKPACTSTTQIGAS